MTPKPDIHTVFLAGGTGKTGRRVAARLVDRELAVRIGSRGQAVPFDWHRPDTWCPALGEEVDAVYLAYSPDLAVPGAADQVAAFTAAARERGARRVVLLSGRGEPAAQEAERAVRDVDPAATVLRSAWMNQNFSEGDFLPAVLAGDVAVPAGPVGEPFVDVSDLADVAVAVLLDPAHEGRTHEVTGPEPLTFAEVVATIAGAAGREVGFRQVATEEFAADLVAAGVPDDAVELITSLFAELFDGRNTGVGSGVPDCLGREARSVATWAGATAATGVWDA